MIKREKTNTVLSEEIDRTLRSIFKEMELNTAQNFHGLLEGNGGTALFLSNYLAFEQTGATSALLASYLDRIAQEAMQNEQHSSIATGVTGTAYLFRHLIKENILDEEDVPYLSEIDQHIISSLPIDFETGNYLLLYGAIGKGIYLFHDLEKHKETITSIVDFLAISAQKNDSDHIWWNSFKNEPKKQNTINFGIAHGLSSIILFLIKCFENDVKKEQCAVLIEKALAFIISHKNNGTNCRYPVCLNEPTPLAGRMAWCYGDLNIAWILFKAHSIIPNTSWHQEGISLIQEIIKLNFCTALVNFQEENKVYDPGFCHGTAGVAYIYQQLYQLSGVEELNKASIEWLNYTIYAVKVKLQNKKELRVLKEIPGTHYQKSPSKNLIEGYAGIGLVFLSFLGYKDEWKSLFLLD